MNGIAYVSTYIPKRCGLATYTHHLRQNVKAAKGWKGLDPVIVMIGSKEQSMYQEPDPALWPLLRDKKEAYTKMARKINNSHVSLVSLQHEFGIFGGHAGEYILEFIENVKKPLVTTFHTVFQKPEEPYRSIQQVIAQRSDRIVVMNRKAIPYLVDAFSIPEDKIVFIPHGTPVPEPEKREQFREQLQWTGRKVLLTFGLLSRGKGIEMLLHTLSMVVKVVPDILYVIVGQTHPEVKKREGESYRQELQELIREKGLEQHVLMIDRYVAEEDLVKYITACDLYVTPYPGMQQITSGTLAYAVGLGRPVVTTPYTYAQDLLRGYEELLVPYKDYTAWAQKLIRLLSNPDELRQWEKRMEQIGRTMHWPHVGAEYARLFARVAQTAQTLSPRGEGQREVKEIVSLYS
ncbi:MULTISPECIES: glycosyltransferase family 4 protein [Aneurinibacillus]|uniref:Glycosyltransferase family 4 protein n=1 Tax=Aneurinibacillus thermoaerophilus TaxID=143495 RepID=A0A1G7XAR5_ANETH|nr:MULTISPECIES: glycosyltransferase family 4 protein [Aneurinibacillus]AMA73285.1 glycosyl transferase family 1 [Aneurinibacillus sp. XH2]MED0674275.1 glycosyltransferase family 4 protein [Aneurinibacillus thermoaerophilus]MED0678293.1 glycosyltransferase family 4 protein [Aneurinibacillus thermoaerophilus]MED0736181.1 glycosyltransferase family 4 protein [Aneurinibacillus thermoaerophilus]MED0757027.1 glycosyltransferase family 4 protein [Aneurinibacillus thermoaerophilus]